MIALHPNLIALLLGAVVTVTMLTFLLRRADALPVDRPNERSLHQRPTPRIGGLAVFPAVTVASVTLGLGDPALWVLLSLAGLLFMLSLVDDRHSLPAGVRFGTHFAVAAIFAYWSAGATLLALAGVIAMTWMTNLYNFMDGANGLAGGMSVIGFSILALASGNAVVASAVVGAAGAFLWFNFDPARVFLGDAGSVPIGFIAAGLSFLGVVGDQWPLWFPLLVFAPFVIDASVTLVRRMLRRERFWAAHRQHYYQRLIRLGWSHRRLALAEYLLMAGCGVLALLLLSASVTWQAIGVALCLAVHVGVMAWIDRRWQATGDAA